MATTPKLDPAAVARLARLALTPEELARYGREFATLLAYFDQIRAVDTEGVEPMVYPLDRRNVLRRDETRPSSPRELILGNAPAAEAGEFFRVPKVIEG
ncbi:MAG TPA: Asp-tRNA(Asn)/Glu-tRNA(Gln) amidotransferase subunit GatC [Planctomycetota bacterium]|nr:Asp-tRNA(Asn)/Glu-tRNA(Gln) amidotransferase subunit GatC [Planctomycetota bacterium]